MLIFLKANIAPDKTPIAAVLRASQALPPGGKVGSNAMSWVVAPDKLFWHNGGTGGYSSYAAFDAEQRLGIVILCNSSTREVDVLAQQLRQLLMPFAGIGVQLAPLGKDETYPLIQALVPGGAAARSGTIAVGDRIVGVEDAAGQLADFKGKTFAEIVATLRGPNDSKVRVVVEPKGTTDRKVHELRRVALDPIPRKFRTPVKFDPAAFDAYVGRYQLQPQVVLTYSRDGDKFYALLSGQERLRIYPESETKFFYKAVDAQVTFVKDKDGKVTHAIHHQNGIDAKAERLEKDR